MNYKINSPKKGNFGENSAWTWEENHEWFILLVARLILDGGSTRADPSRLHHWPCGLARGRFEGSPLFFLDSSVVHINLLYYGINKFFSGFKTFYLEYILSDDGASWQSDSTEYALLYIYTHIRTPKKWY